MPHGGTWIYEIKFDGYRALALRGGSETRLLSRNQKDLSSKFTEVKDLIAALDVQDAVIDGEIVALDEKGRSSFQLLQGFDMGQARPPIVYYAFRSAPAQWKGSSNSTHWADRKFKSSLAHCTGNTRLKGFSSPRQTFPKDANDYVSKIGSKIVLIDGSRLAELMIEFGVGVTDATYTVNRIDNDFFETI
jgi:hypothetical protein